MRAASQSGNLLAKVLGMGNVKLALIAGVIGLVAAGFVLLWNKSEKFRETVMALWDQLQTLGGTLADMAVAIWEKTAPLLEMLGNALLTGLERAVELLAPVAGNIIGIFSGIVDLVTGVFTGDWDKALQSLQNIFGNALTGLGNLAVAGFTAILEIGSSIWPAIDNAVQAGIAAISSRFPALGAVLGSLWSTVQKVWSYIQTILQNVIQFVQNVFSGNWSGAWQNIVDIFGNLFGMIVNLAKAPINAVISAINFVLAKINGISVTIPDWVPGVGGTTLGFNIPTIPALAAGGVATAPTLAMVGEGGEPEAIMPLSKLAALLEDWSKPKPDGRDNDPAERDPDQDGGGFSRGGRGEQITYAPVFNFYGLTAKEEVVESGRVSFAEFKRLYKQMKAEEVRKSFSPT